VSFLPAFPPISCSSSSSSSNAIETELEFAFNIPPIPISPHTLGCGSWGCLRKVWRTHVHTADGLYFRFAWETEELTDFHCVHPVVFIVYSSLFESVVTQHNIQLYNYIINTKSIVNHNKFNSYYCHIISRLISNNTTPIPRASKQFTIRIPVLNIPLYNNKIAATDFIIWNNTWRVFNHRFIIHCIFIPCILYCNIVSSIRFYWDAVQQCVNTVTMYLPDDGFKSRNM
jgi:hypothetical protein